MMSDTGAYRLAEPIWFGKFVKKKEYRWRKQ